MRKVLPLLGVATLLTAAAGCAFHHAEAQATEGSRPARQASGSAQSSQNGENSVDASSVEKAATHLKGEQETLDETFDKKGTVIIEGSNSGSIVINGNNIRATFGAGDGHELVGSDHRITEERKVAEFDRIELGGVTDLEVKVGTAQKVTVEYDDNLLPFLRTRVQNGTLSIDMMGNTRSKRGSKITISVAKLNGLDLTGAVDGSVTGVRSANLQIKLSGSGTLKVSGETDKLDLEVSGSGSVGLKDLRIKTAKIDVSGSGDVSLNTADFLNANVSGSGSVNYIRGPKSLQKDVSGSGSIGPE
jgi:hypothetical protein